MTVEVIDTDIRYGTGGLTFSLSGVEEGDLMVCFMGCDNDPTNSSPAGWTELFNWGTSSGSDRSGVGAYKVYEPGDDLTPTIGSTGFAAAKIGVAAVFRGATFDDWGWAQSGGEASPSTPQVTPTDAPALVTSWLWQYGYDREPPVGYTKHAEDFRNLGGPWHYIGLGSLAVANTDPVTPGPWQGGGSHKTMKMSIALLEAGGGGGGAAASGLLLGT